VIFNEGGEQKCHEWITFDHDVELSSDSGGETPSIPKTTKEQAAETPAVVQPPPADMQHSKAAPMPTLASNRPPQTIHAPVRDDDKRFTTSSYTRKHTATQVTATEAMPNTDEHAHAAQITPEVDPLTYKEAMSHPDVAEWLAACMEELETFK